MNDVLENITQKLANEMESTGTITFQGQSLIKNTLRNDSPYAGLCRPAVAKMVEMVKEYIPNSKVDLYVSA